MKMNKHWEKAPATTAFSHRHTELLHNGRKMNVFKKHQTVEMSG